MEILVKKESSVKFDVPESVTDATFKVFVGDVQIGAELNAVINNGVASCSIPYEAVVREQDISVELSFQKDSTTYTDIKPIKVVTPLLESWEIKEIHPNATPEEIIRVEAAVRRVIESITGQSFGKFYGVKKVYHDGAGYQLPSRLLKAVTINGVSAHHQHIVHDGYGLYGRFRLADGEIYLTSGPIDTFGLQVKANKHIGIEIEGEWGWESVPDAVREAAKLLVNDYACAEASYRDKMLISMTAADWRLQFAPRAFIGTGNLRADQLLNEFILKGGWVAI